MPPSQQQQGGGGGDNSLDFLWMIVLIVGSLTIAWLLGQEYIVAATLKIRLYEAKFIELFLDGYAFIANLLHLPIPTTLRLDAALTIINSRPEKMPLSELVAVSNKVGYYFMIPVAVLVTGMAVLTYLWNVGAKFKHTYSMDTLRKTENKIWPQVSPVMRVDLVKKDLDEGPWASSLTPMLFAKKHKLLIELKRNGRTNVLVNEGAAYRVFALQVGQFYRDIETFPLHVQALFAIFLARANQDRKNADMLLAQIATSSSSDKLNFNGVKEIVAKHKGSKYARYVESRNAYLLTAMATLLELARTDGVLATAEFIWLKPLDRPLWYMLNAVGRQTAFPEIAGAFAHWLAEKKVDRALKVPMIDEAVKALDLAIKEIIYEPDEEG